ncbi:MAG: hypothetical protein MI741_19425 [Rhodospirillales bacterium]|nr:hypothetical protein [Rhodospirillales bacterium]
MSKTTQEAQIEQQQAVRPVAPEDVAVGDHVVVTETTFQFIGPCEAWSASRDVEPYRVRIMPFDAGWPYRVIAVCVPFVMVEDIDGDISHLDLRRQNVAKVPPSYTKAVIKRRKQLAKKKRKGNG